MKKQKSAVKVASKVRVKTHHAVAVGVMMMAAALVGSSFAAAAIKASKNTTTSEPIPSCTPAPPTMQLLGADELSHSVHMIHYSRGGGPVTDAIVERREEKADRSWSEWQALSRSHTTGVHATMDLSAYPNKDYQYRATAYNADCAEPASQPSAAILVRTYNFLILDDDDNGDPHYSGTIRNINGSPWYVNNVEPWRREILRVDECFAYPGAAYHVRDNFLSQNEWTGPMGNQLNFQTIECANGCFEGRCTNVGETCQAGWYCIAPSRRSRVDENCQWVEAEMAPNEDFENYRCQGGEFIYVGPPPPPPPPGSKDDFTIY